jgi:hypothetical protein
VPPGLARETLRKIGPERFGPIDLLVWVSAVSSGSRSKSPHNCADPLARAARYLAMSC